MEEAASARRGRRRHGGCSHPLEGGESNKGVASERRAKATEVLASERRADVTMLSRLTLAEIKHIRGAASGSEVVSDSRRRSDVGNRHAALSLEQTTISSNAFGKKKSFLLSVFKTGPFI